MPSRQENKENVVALPSFTSIPPPLIPLTTEAACREYQRIGQMLFDLGTLSVSRHMTLSRYAAQMDAITMQMKDGKAASATAFKTLSYDAKAMGLDSVNKPISAREVPLSNRFARGGFSAKR
jgi:hypothetical protein